MILFDIHTENFTPVGLLFALGPPVSMLLVGAIKNRVDLTRWLRSRLAR